ncbi:MAG: Nif3-like dinuclear metal center hexameric protein [Phycisphaerales bacterium]
MAEAMMKVSDVVEAMERLAPLGLAQEWDNVGLLVGGRGEQVRARVLLTIDLTEGVLREGERRGAGMIVAYHPPIFGKVSRITDEDPLDGIVLRAARAGMAVYSPHTALDGAVGGMGDWLANVAAASDAEFRGEPLRAHAPILPVAEGARVKVVTFAPSAAITNLRAAMTKAGAGRIGGYTACSFSTVGEGTFFGGAGTKPRVGKPGGLERVMETRIEMVCPRGVAGQVVEAVRGAHPYEEPPIDVVALEETRGQPSAGQPGSGRAAEIAGRGLSVAGLAARVRRRLGVARVEVVEGRKGSVVRRVAVCPGAGESLIDAALSLGCDALVTGEMKHHEQLRCARRGLTVVLAGHTQTERGYLPHLRTRLLEQIRAGEGGRAARAQVMVSGADGPPGRLAG